LRFNIWLTKISLYITMSTIAQAIFVTWYMYKHYLLTKRNLFFDISIIYNVKCSTVHLVWKTIKIFMKTDRNVILQLFSSCIINEQTNIKFLYLWRNRCVFSVLCLALALLVYNSDINRYFIPPLDDSREYWTCCL